MNQRKKLIAGAAGALVLVLGCSAATPQPTPTLIPTLTQIPTATPTLSPTPDAGCRWDGLIEAWEDTDGNGTREPGEPPMADVTFGIEHSGKTDPDRVYHTDESGGVKAEILMPDCDPENYKITLGAYPESHSAPAKTALALSEANEGGVLQFGLIPLPGGAPTPVFADFGDCDVLNRTQAEEVLGPLAYDPSPLEWIGPGGLRSGLCIYSGTLNQASVGVIWFASPDEAKNNYRQYGGEPISGVGDEAVWSETGLTLIARQGAVVISIEMMNAEGAKDQAIKIGQFAAVRVPQ